MDYTTLSLTDVSRELAAAARDAAQAFGTMDARQLNWRPPDGGWSIGQCIEHLLRSNEIMLASADAAMAPHAPRGFWQRLPLWPGLLGPFLVKAMSPQATRKAKTTPRAEPPSEVPADVVARFATQQHGLAARAEATDPVAAAACIMVSPFMGIVTYSVLDGWRLMAAHNHRHLEQARRVAATPGFPVSEPPVGAV
ncbi:MAG: DinB family protein [Vicinamibacterales bacterium]